MSYAVICDARTGKGAGISVLALVDRGKSRSMWWTSDDPRIVLNFHSLEAARATSRRLYYNRTRVVPYEDAINAIEEQANEIAHHEACADAEAGWDGHKNSF